MNLTERLLRRLQLAEVQTDTFRGGAGEGGTTEQTRLFGGLVAAQATMAASLATQHDFRLHSLHAYFLRPGRAEADISFKVTRTKEGRNFHTRSVDAWQNDQLIFQLQASFQRPDDNVSHSAAMPDVPSPADLPNRDQLRGRANWREMPIDVRMVSEITGDEPQSAEQRIWFKGNGELPPQAGAQGIHDALLVYASDRSLLDTASRPHADRGRLAGASLDHAVWFHRPVNMAEWHLYDMFSPVVHDSRGLVFGYVFNADGLHVATVAQEGVVRFTKP